MSEISIVDCDNTERISELIEVGTTSRGYTIYKREEYGINIFWSDEIGGGVMVYNSIVDPESVLLALKSENIVPVEPITQRDLIYKIAGRNKWQR